MRRIKGISLLEMLLVITIGTAIIMTAVRYFNVTSRDMRVTQAIGQIKTLTSASYEWLQAQKQDNFSNKDGGTEISMQQLIDTGLIDNSETTTKDPWAGTITVEPGSDPTRIKIVLDQLPKKACKNLARRLDSISKISMPPCAGVSNEYSGEF